MDARLVLDALVTGLPYAFNFVGVWLVYRLLKDFDLTVDGSFTLGAAVSAVLITLHGWGPVPATIAGAGAGAAAGLVTALLHLRMGISLLLSGIITMIALWSVNLRVMGLPNVSFLGQDTIFSGIASDSGLSNDLRVLALLSALLLVTAVALGLFLKTELGLSMRATGANQLMAQSVGVSVGVSVLLFLTISNFLVGLSGAVTAQQQVFADINMGIGVILVAITAILLGELVVRRTGSVWMGITAVIAGTVLYHLAVAVVVRVGLRPSDLRAFTAFILVVAIGASMLISRGENWLRIRRSDARSSAPPVAAAASLADSAGGGSGERPAQQPIKFVAPATGRRRTAPEAPAEGRGPLSLQNVGVIYNRGLPNEVVALRSIDLDVPAGQFVTIIGSNGAGKSTLVGVVAGAVRPTLGDILMNGKSIAATPPHVRARRISRVFQDPLAGTSPDLTIEENLSLAGNRSSGHLSLKFAVTRTKRREFARYLEQFGLGLETRLSENVDRLSGGQRQALALVMAVMSLPEILLLDEHTAALDPKNQGYLQDMTNELVRESGCTTLMVTHNMEQAIRYGDRMIMLHRGRILFDVEGDQKKELTVERLVSAFHRAGDAVFTDEMLFG